MNKDELFRNMMNAYHNMSAAHRYIHNISVHPVGGSSGIFIASKKKDYFVCLSSLKCVNRSDMRILFVDNPVLHNVAVCGKNRIGRLRRENADRGWEILCGDAPGALGGFSAG